MTNEFSQNSKFSVKRRHVRVAAFAVLLLSVGYILVLQIASKSVVHEDIGVITDIPSPAVTGPTMAESKPVRLRIPKISVDTTFVAPLGLNPDQTVEVPDSFERVGWYQHSPAPGELGPAVVLGHVDSREGPAVFYLIGQLEEGDVIEIDREDGSAATFEVVAIGRYEQAGFPTELVYGDIDHAGLRLVTCSGTYDREALRYSHNTVVFAKLVVAE